jgi:gliding motility-associated protein GldC
MIKKTSDIKFTIGLDENNVPTQISWKADDNPEGQESKECKAIMLALFDRETLDTLKIDLWIKEMQLVEMDRFFFQTLKGMSDTYAKATNNLELANEMRRFVEYFGQKTEIIPTTE